MILEIAFTSLAGVVGLLLFIFYLRKGQFEDIEDVKYDLFRHDEES